MKLYALKWHLNTQPTRQSTAGLLGQWLNICKSHSSSISQTLLSASQDYGSQINDNTCLSQNSSIDIDVENHIPSPVKEPDPILATCAPDWLTDGKNVLFLYKFA